MMNVFNIFKLFILNLLSFSQHFTYLFLINNLLLLSLYFIKNWFVWHIYMILIISSSYKFLMFGWTNISFCKRFTLWLEVNLLKYLIVIILVLLIQRLTWRTRGWTWRRHRLFGFFSWSTYLRKNIVPSS